jgi:hypothetical protein
VNASPAGISKGFFGVFGFADCAAKESAACARGPKTAHRKLPQSVVQSAIERRLGVCWKIVIRHRPQNRRCLTPIPRAAPKEVLKDFSPARKHGVVVLASPNKPIT